MNDLLKLAQDILAGDTLPFGPHGVYDSSDWIDAAQQAVDPIEQDFADLRAMAEYEDIDWLYSPDWSPAVAYDRIAA